MYGLGSGEFAEYEVKNVEWWLEKSLKRMYLKHLQKDLDL